jgi:Protein of unknown function (DUF3054)
VVEVVADAAALVVFVAVGVATHGASVGAFFRDAACFLGCWFAVALVVRLYAGGGWRRLAVTWLVGVTGGVFLRAAIVDRWPGAFYGVALGFTAVFVSTGRVGGQALLRNRADLRKDIAAADDARHRRADDESAA